MRTSFPFFIGHSTRSFEKFLGLLQSGAFAWSLMSGLFPAHGQIHNLTATRCQKSALLNEFSKLVDEGVLQSTLAENFGAINAENIKRAVVS